MRSTMLTLRWLIRVCAVVQLTLGALFWTGNAYSLVQAHMLIGSALVLSLWAQAGLALRAGGRPGPSIAAVLWGMLVVALGVTQDGLLPGDFHWLIKVLHLGVGVAAVGLAETLARRALDSRAAHRPRSEAAAV